MVFSFIKKEMAPIGVDIGSGYVKMAQLDGSNGMPKLIEATSEQVPDHIQVGTPEWQKWAVKAIKKMMTNSAFKSRNAISSMSSDDIFIEHVKVSGSEEDIEKKAFEQIKKKLPFSPENAMVQCVTSEISNGKNKRDVVVMVADKVKVQRHLAIFERAGLELKSMSVWPLAITQTYTRFFARRAADAEVVSMLLDVGANHSNVIISKHDNLLFARVIPLGFNQLKTDSAGEELLSELLACWRYFESMETGQEISKLLLLSGSNIDKAVCEKVALLAKQMHVPAQIGDVLAAIESATGNEISQERRGSRLCWATSFGLSLSGKTKNKN